MVLRILVAVAWLAGSHAVRRTCEKTAGAVLLAGETPEVGFAEEDLRTAVHFPAGHDEVIQLKIALDKQAGTDTSQLEALATDIHKQKAFKFPVKYDPTADVGRGAFGFVIHAKAQLEGAGYAPIVIKIPNLKRGALGTEVLESLYGEFAKLGSVPPHENIMGYLGLLAVPMTNLPSNISHYVAEGYWDEHDPIYSITQLPGFVIEPLAIDLEGLLVNYAKNSFHPWSEVEKKLAELGSRQPSIDLGNIFAGLAEGSAHLHKFGVLHRDFFLYGTNVMVRKKADRLSGAIIDFGASLACESMDGSALAVDDWLLADHLVRACSQRMGQWRWPEGEDGNVIFTDIQCNMQGTKLDAHRRKGIRAERLSWLASDQPWRCTDKVRELLSSYYESEGQPLNLVFRELKGHPLW